MHKKNYWLFEIIDSLKDVLCNAFFKKLLICSNKTFARGSFAVQQLDELPCFNFTLG